MAVIRQVDLNTLPEVQTVSDSDNVMLFDETTNAASRIDHDQFAKNIVERYNGSVLCGSTMTVKDALTLLNARISEAIADLSDQTDSAIAAEVLDIRVGADGTSYNTAGESVRTQIGALLSELSTTSNTVSGLSTRTESLELSILDKVDGAYVEDGYLYMTSNGEVVVGPLGPFNGGGGGGGSSTNNAVLTATNTTGWLAKTISYGISCVVSINWSSIEDDLSTGNGTLSILVNGVSKLVRTVQQGDVSVDVSPYIGTGSNTVKVKITDVYGNAKTINFSITMLALTLTSPFDSSQPFTSSITFPYVPSGNVEKTVYFIVDGTTIGTVTTSVSGRQLSYTIPQQSHGSHTLRVYYEAIIEGQSVLSNELYYDLICLDESSNVPIITSTYADDATTQFSLISIPYYVYSPNSLTSSVTLLANSQEVATLTVDRTQQLWSYRAISVGELTLEIVCGTTRKSFVIDVGESDVTAQAETRDLSLYLTSQGRSNSESNPATWTYNDISATMTGFNYTSDGWIHDEDDNVTLRVTGRARVSIPYQIFASDFRQTGKTIEFEFKTSDVRDYDAIILSCFSDNRGITLTPQKMIIKSEQSQLDVQYKENEHVRVSFVIEKRSENRLIYCYLNGIISAVAQYPDQDDFQQGNPVGITIGSDYCTTDIYNIRIYDNDLTRYQMLDNWIADTPNVDEMLARYRHNNIFDEYGQIVIENLPNDLPYLILEGAALPQYKGDKKTMSGSYVDPINSSKSFTFTGASVDVQGTSSQFYARKNYKISFKNGFVINDSVGDKYAMNSDAIPVSTFCFKADVASSEGANNVELVRLYNDICPYKTPAQVENSNVRQGIDGFPIVIFWNNGTETTFIGKYNFNNDKSTEDVFGFTDGDESWETLNNTSLRTVWKNADFAGNDWQEDFEARYPDTKPPYTDVTQLSEFAAFLVSTDRTQATNNALSSPVTYDGVQYTTDSADYRLAKFKAEIGNYTELQSALFYYLFTELFLMVDSRAKNAFPSFIGSEVNA